MIQVVEDAKVSWKQYAEMWKIKDHIVEHKEVVKEPYYCVTLKVKLPGKPADSVTGIGFAKQNRYGKSKDEWDPKVGHDIAFTRALKDATQKLIRIRKSYLSNVTDDQLTTYNAQADR